jgi:hypothetical protein
MKISFVKGTVAREVAFDQIRVSGQDKIYYQNAKVSSVELPVNPTETEILFTFTFEGRTETLHMNYKTSVDVISESCGAYTTYGDLEIIDTTFTSIEIVNTQLSTNATVNIQISVD